jgi:acetolactate synthase I/II/III large subunit
MNGAESLVHTLINNGLKVCFANPGTSEMHFVAALDRIPGLRCIPGLQENVVTGMADGYGRVARDPAVTLLHCSGGLTNGIANLLNARKAFSPIVNIVGDQATYHAPYDPPLAADTESFARASSHWMKKSSRTADVGMDAAQAVQAARSSPGQVATLILPSDSSWNDGGVVADRLSVMPPSKADAHAVQQAERILRSHSNTVLILGGPALTEGAQYQAARLAAKTGCKVIAQSITGFVQRGKGRMALQRVPYPVDAAIAFLKDAEQIILVGSKGALGFFAYPGKPSFHHQSHARVHVLARVEQDCEDALGKLADAFSAPAVPMPVVKGKVDIPKGPPTSEGFSQLLTAIMPENAIVADEAITFGSDLWAHTHRAAPHDWMMVTGGAIGFGMPCATGAAVAGGGRRVINIQADGSAMYTIQSLWTQAREKLPVTTIIINNRSYRILLGEYQGVGANPGPTALNMLSLANPDMDFVSMANGMGVEAVKAETLEDCAALMQASFKKDEPFLIELIV